MNINDELARQGWLLEETKTGKWVRVVDARPAFYETFGTKRVGKLIGSTFYVVPAELQVPAERSIRDLDLRIKRVASTSGRGIEYLGFECDGVPAARLSAFAKQLHDEVERCLAK